MEIIIFKTIKTKQMNFLLYKIHLVFSLYLWLYFKYSSNTSSNFMRHSKLNIVWKTEIHQRLTWGVCSLFSDIPTLDISSTTNTRWNSKRRQNVVHVYYCFPPFTGRHVTTPLLDCRFAISTISVGGTCRDSFAFCFYSLNQLHGKGTTNIGVSTQTTHYHCFLLRNCQLFIYLRLFYGMFDNKAGCTELCFTRYPD